MRILILTCFALLNITNINNLHESISATFNVIRRGHVLMLEIDFDEENFIKFGASSKSLHVAKEDFSKYLHKTTSWEFNGQKLVPQVLEIKSDKHHTKVICFLSKYKESIKSVTIKNELQITFNNSSVDVQKLSNGIYC